MKVTNLKSMELDLSEEEAFALLGLCMTSPNKLDATAEQAMRKLANFCKSRTTMGSEHSANGQRLDHVI